MKQIKLELQKALNKSLPMRDLKGNVCETGHFYVNGKLYSFYAQYDDVRCSEEKLGINHMFKRVPSCEEEENYMWLITEHVGDFDYWELREL